MDKIFGTNKNLSGVHGLTSTLWQPRPFLHLAGNSLGWMQSEKEWTSGLRNVWWEANKPQHVYVPAVSVSSQSNS